jgi:hypothetical protein
MLYGERKVLEVSRNLLFVNCNRKFIKEEKARVSRKLRRVTKEKLKFISKEDNYYDGNLDSNYFDIAKKEKIIRICRNRKLNSFIRWAKAKAKDVPDGEKYNFIKPMLPSRCFATSRIMGFIKYEEGISKNLFNSKLPCSHIAIKPKVAEKYIKDCLREIIIDNKIHRLFNNLIKGSHESVYWEYYVEVLDMFHEDGFYFEKHFIRKDEGPRLLRGLHNIDNFVDDVKRAFDVSLFVKKNNSEYTGMYVCQSLVNPHSHREWKKAVSKFIEIWTEDKTDFVRMHKIRLSDPDFSKTNYHRSKYLWSW